MEEKKSGYTKLALLSCFVMVLSISIAVYMMFYQKPNGKITKGTDKQTDTNKEKPTTEDDELYTSDSDDTLVCDTKTRNLVYISYKEFNDKITKNDVCNTYVIKEFNAKLIPTKVVLANDEADFAIWKVLINGKELDVEYKYYLSINKFKDYYVISDMAMGGGYQNHYIFDKDGNLKTKLDAFDDNHCAYLTAKITNDEFYLGQYYVTSNDSKYASAATCVNVEKVKEKCSDSNYFDYVAITYQLTEENGVLNLEESNYTCKEK